MPEITGEGPTAQTRMLALGFTQGPPAAAAARPGAKAWGTGQAPPCTHSGPCASRRPCLGWEGLHPGSPAQTMAGRVVPAWEIFPLRTRRPYHR